MAISIKISITQNSQSVTNNTSNVTASVIASWTGGSFNTYLKPGWLKIDGTTYEFTSSFNTGRTTSGSQTLFTKTVNIPHSSDGTKMLSCSASYTSGVSSGTVTASASTSLTTIPRKSSLTAGNGVLGVSQKLTISRASDSFKHTISYKCGNASGTICNKTASETVDWIPPIDLAVQNKENVKVNITLTIVTYSGSTNIGSDTKNISCTIPANIAPSCELSISDDTDISNTYGNMVKGLSKIKAVITPTISYGSPISSYQTVINGNVYNSASFTTSALETSGEISITSVVTDKRGRSGASTPIQITVLEYNKPLINKLSVRRCNRDGSESNDKGEYIQVSFAGAVTSLNNLNTSTYVLGYKKSSDSVYTEVGLEEYTNQYVVTDGSYMFPADTGSSYDIELSLYDNHDFAHKITNASTGYTLMHWNAAGDGMGIGKVSELPDVLDIGLQTRFHGGVLQTVLAPGADLNEITLPNWYVSSDAAGYEYMHSPITSNVFDLVVMGIGDNKLLKQTLTYYDDGIPNIYERVHDGISWGEWLYIDRIIKTGINDIWHYEKWSSGKAVCWGKKNYGSLDVKTAWGNLYITSNLSINFPTGLFSENPQHISIEHLYGASKGFVLQGSTAPTTTGITNFAIACGASGAYSNATLSFHVIGRWK